MNERIPIYEREPYCRTREARVVAVGEADGTPWAELSETIFYPEGGGQPADHGRLGDVEVLDVQKADGVVRHALNRPVELGPVDLELDWARRYDHMQQHTAQHVLTAIAADRFGWPTTSFHLGPELCDIELDVARLDTDDLGRLEDAVAEEIRRDRAILARRFDPDRVDWQQVRTRGLPPGHHGRVRLVDINGLDLAACGGTHVRSTGEIGALALLATESLRGGTRLSWVAGDRVRRRLRGHEGRNAELRRVLGTGDDELVAVAGLKIDQAKAAGRQLRAMAERWADARAEALASRSERVLTEHEDGVDAGTLGRLARSVVEQAPDRLGLFTAATPDGSGGFFVLVAGSAAIDAGVDLGELGGRVAAVLDGRGGGRGAVYQGRAGSFDRLAEAAALVREAVADAALGDE